jgi:hypothetical protein
MTKTLLGAWITVWIVSAATFAVLLGVEAGLRLGGWIRLRRALRDVQKAEAEVEAVIKLDELTARAGDIRPQEWNAWMALEAPEGIDR